MLAHHDRDDAAQVLSRPERNHPDLGPLLHLHHRRVSPEQMHRFERHMAEIFTAFGLDLTTDGTKETPQRFLRALYDSTAGYEGDPKLATIFDAESHPGADRSSAQIVEGPIPLFALCEHHALPFYGRAYIGYIGDEQIIGISKLTRLVRLFARRFTVQERLGEQIADTLESLVAPRGVAVYLEAHHLCTQMRGVQESSSLTRTTTWRGSYETDAALRTEFLAMCGVHP